MNERIKELAEQAGIAVGGMLCICTIQKIL